MRFLLLEKITQQLIIYGIISIAITILSILRVDNANNKKYSIIL